MAAATTVGGLDLDLDAFEGPFDLLLTLVLREELALAEVDLAEIVIAFVAHLAERERARPRRLRRVPRPDLGAARAEGARPLPRRGGRAAELEPEAGRRGARAPACRLPAGQGRGRLARASGSPPREDRFFRLGPAPLAAARRRAGARSARTRRGSRARCALLAAEPPAPSTAHMALRFPPARAVPRALALAAAPPQPARLRPGGRRSLPRRGRGRLPRAARAAQAAARSRSPRRPRSRRSGSRAPPRKEPRMDRPLRLIDRATLEQLARIARGAARRRLRRRSASEELAAAAGEEPGRVGDALELLAERYREGRSGIVLEHVAGGYAFRASREAAAGLRAPVRAAGRARPDAGGAGDARDRRLPRALHATGDRPHPRRQRRRRSSTGLLERGLLAEDGRDEALGARALPHDAALRARLRARLARRAAPHRRPRAPTPRRCASGSRRSPSGAGPEPRHAPRSARRASGRLPGWRLPRGRHRRDIRGGGDRALGARAGRRRLLGRAGASPALR